MKNLFAVLVCAILATALAAPAVDQEKVRQSLDRVKEAHEACNQDPATFVDRDAVKKAHDEGGKEPANAAAHTLCLSKNLGWQNADGSVNAEAIRSKIKAITGDTSDLEQEIRECVTPQATPEATAKHIFDCYKKRIPMRPNGTRPSS